MTTKANRQQNALDLPLVLGLILAVFGGVAVIGIAIVVTGNAQYLLALILLAWGVERVRDTSREYVWKPTVLGLVMGLLYVGLGAIVYFVKDGNYLWAMVLINWLTDSIV